jgi:hypothetical protein
VLTSNNPDYLRQVTARAGEARRWCYGGRRRREHRARFSHGHGWTKIHGGEVLAVPGFSQASPRAYPHALGSPRPRGDGRGLMRMAGIGG